MVQVNSVRRDLRKTVQVIQLDVDPYKADNIVGCRLSDHLCNLSHNCNIIINHR